MADASFPTRTVSLKPFACGLMLAIAAACGSDGPTRPNGSGAGSDSLRVADSIRVADSLHVADSIRVADSLAAVDPPPDSPPVAGPPPADSVVPDSLAWPETMAPQAYTGIAFGDFHIPADNFKPPYSGALLALSRKDLREVLAAARARGMRVIISLAGRRNRYTVNGRFDFNRWKGRVDSYKNYRFDAYVQAGTIIGHYLVDEPFCAPCWGGTKITLAQLEEMARYSKSLWPNLPTGIRAAPSHLGTTRISGLDFAWAQWEGPLHIPSYQMSAETFRDVEISAAKSLGLGLVFGLNYLDAGDGSSHINGTYAQDPKPEDSEVCHARGCYRYMMSVSEIRHVGEVFAGASYGCALLNWQYDPAFLGRAGVRDALNDIAKVAQQRSPSSCKATR